MDKQRRNNGILVAVYLLMATVPCIHAAGVNVFLDNGYYPGSSNSGVPYFTNDRDVTWEVTATAESGLVDIGAAVMTVRMVTFNMNSSSRGANTAGGNGLAVTTGSNSLWFDASSGEAALFQLAFYSDLAKTMEITGLEIGLVSIASRVRTGTTKMVDAFVGSGEITFGSTNITDTTDVLLGGTILSRANDTANSFDSALGLKTTNDELGIYSMSNAAVGRIESFSEDDSLWIRRRNTTVGDDIYQLGGLTFEVTSGATGYSAWATSFGVGADTNDPDGDGLLNVYEYGLGGDPTNAADQGISPVFAAAGGILSYIYPQLSDPNHGLDYHLELTDDLVLGIWTNANYVVTGTNRVSGDFDYVTNEVSTTTQMKQFIKLMIDRQPEGQGFDRLSVNIVEDYGAIPNDGMDDTAAIQAALDDLEILFNIGSAGVQMAGVSMVFPAGTYDISKRLEFVVDHPPSRWGGLMIRGEGRTKTIIRSRNTDASVPDGTFYFDVDISSGSTGIQIEDLGFRAAEPDAGPAIEVASPGNLPRVLVSLRNVDIGRTASANCYTYGFKGSDLMRPLFDDIRFEGIKGVSVCGIYIEDSYGHDIKDCTISGVDTGIHHHYKGGEANHINRVDISNVATGVYVEMKPYIGVYMSNANGKLLNSTISASEYGVRFKYKNGVYISNNTFLSEAGSAVYKDVEIGMCTTSFVTGNSFVGTGANRTGVSLRVDELDAKQTIISDNTFGSFNTGIDVGADVAETLVMNNSFSTTTEIIDNGDGTLERAGTPDPFVSLARVKDAEEFEWGSDQGQAFNVREYGAIGDGVRDDTVAVQSAAAALKAYLNGSLGGDAVLYFPAGVYKLTDRIDLIQTPFDPAWNKLTLHGDGKWSSIILRNFGGTDGVFNIDFQKAPVRLNVHNMMLIAGYADAGAAVAVKEPYSSSLRSLYMFNVDMKRVYSADNYFTTCLNGTNLEDPYLENLWISMYKIVEEGEFAPGTAGVYLRGGRGLTVDRVTITDGIETGIDVQMNGGTLLIKSHTAIQVGRVGCKVDAGGGTVALEGCHLNCPDLNLDLRNASAASYVNSMTLTGDGDSVDARTNMATLRLADCGSAEIRNNLFSKSHPYILNSLRKCIWLDGSSNSNIRIYANRFEAPGETYVYVAAGSSNTQVIQNRFAQTEVDDLEDHGVGTVFVHSYELNGKVGANYLIKNPLSGLYLEVEGNAVDCDQRTVGTDTQWAAIYQGNGEYVLENQQNNNLLNRVGNEVDGAGTTSHINTRWNIVNLGDGLYSLQNLSGTANYLDYDPVGGVDCSEAAVVDDQQRWKMFLCRDLNPAISMSAGKAALLVTCDDSYELYFNGNWVETNSQWETAERYVIELVSGKNVIAIKGINAEDSAALLAEVVRLSAVVGTDISWKVSLSGPAGWQNISFDDSGWANAREYGAYGSAPWGTTVEGMPLDTPAKWIWSNNSRDNTVYFRCTIVVQ